MFHGIKNIMMIKLSDIFVFPSGKSHCTRPELFARPIKKDFIEKIEKRLELSYLEKGSGEANVCFANEKQLRPAFKQYFSKADLIHYLSAVLPEDSFDIDSDEVPFPDINNFFGGQ